MLQGPLNSAEYRLLCTYHEKPLMTRPQQHFFTGPGYLEIDLDVHSYTYLARRALTSYVPRLAAVIYDNAFVVQASFFFDSVFVSRLPRAVAALMPAGV